MWGPILLLIVFGSTVWVCIDAAKQEFVRWWFVWGIGSLLLWIIVFPIYLAVRGKRVKDSVQTLMWVVFACGVFAALLSMIT